MIKYTDKVSEASMPDHFSNTIADQCCSSFLYADDFLLVGIDCDGFVDKFPMEIERWVWDIVFKNNHSLRAISKFPQGRDLFSIEKLNIADF